MKTIALVEDDFILSDTVADLLHSEMFDVEQIFSFRDAEVRLYETTFDVIILDISLPDGDGLALARLLRERGVQTPILFLTSRVEAMDVAKGFAYGGDDYVKKPFAPLELIARIQNLIKRGFFHRTEEMLPLGGDFYFDILYDQVKTSSGEIIPVYMKQIKILKILLEYRGQIVTYDDLLQGAWDFSEEASVESLRTHIKNLRHCIPPLAIETLRNVGYRLV